MIEGTLKELRMLAMQLRATSFNGGSLVSVGDALDSATNSLRTQAQADKEAADAAAWATSQ